MNYLALGLFCLWVLTEVLSAQDAVTPVVSVAGVSVSENFADRLVEAALYRTTQKVRYDSAYVALDYPGGDVPADTGVCTDVVIRSYRALGIDLQPLVHEDMKASFSAYPKLWGLKRPDKNIDHRRVPNPSAGRPHHLGSQWKRTLAHRHRRGAGHLRAQHRSRSRPGDWAAPVEGGGALSLSSALMGMSGELWQVLKRERDGSVEEFAKIPGQRSGIGTRLSSLFSSPRGADRSATAARRARLFRVHRSRRQSCPACGLPS